MVQITTITKQGTITFVKVLQFCLLHTKYQYVYLQMVVYFKFFIVCFNYIVKNYNKFYSALFNSNCHKLSQVQTYQKPIFFQFHVTNSRKFCFELLKKALFRSHFYQIDKNQASDSCDETLNILKDANFSRSSAKKFFKEFALDCNFSLSKV